MTYFRELPNLNYQSTFTDRSSSKDYVVVKNIFRRAKLRDDLKYVFTSLVDYYIKDGVRPDQVADDVYGDPELDWVVLTSANVINVRDEWPLDSREVYEYSLNKYGNDINQIRHYETTEVKDSNDDYFALNEAIKRRCKNLEKNSLELPEVILVDGGKGQLNTVKKYLDDKFLEKIRLISVSKGPNRNEKYDVLHDGNISHELRNSDEISKLLQLIRNESHRFALNHHRKRRSKELFSSSLDGIDGIGPKLKINLIRFFGGLDKLNQASLDDLKSAPGIGERKAKKIYYHLKDI